MVSQFSTFGQFANDADRLISLADQLDSCPEREQSLRWLQVDSPHFVLEATHFPPEATMSRFELHREEIYTDLAQCPRSGEG